MSKWKEVIIDNNFSIIRNGVSIKQGKIDGGYPITRIETISECKVNRDKMGYAGIVDIERYKSYILETGDILMSHINSEKHLGKVACYEKIEDEIIIHGMNLLCLKPISNKIDYKYAKYYFDSNYFKNQVPTIIKKSVNQASFTVTALKQLKMPLPPLQEQKHIAEVLDKAQEIIDCHNKQLVEFDNLIQAIFCDMFGDPFLNDKNWNKEKIGDRLKVLTDYHSNGSYETLRDNVTLLDEPDYALMVRTTDLEKNNFADGVKYISEHAYNHLEKSKVFGGEIIINKIGSAGKVYLMPYLDRPVSLAMNQFLLRFDNKINHIYAYCFLTTGYSTQNLQDKVRGAVTKTITKDAVRDVEILVPPIDIQEEFAKIVTNINEQKEIVKRSLDEAQTLFNSLMSEYFD